jgi:hypothetical protein
MNTQVKTHARTTMRADDDRTNHFASLQSKSCEAESLSKSNITAQNQPCGKGSRQAAPHQQEVNPT